MGLSKTIQICKRYLVYFAKWTLLGLTVGILGGLVGAGFHHALHFVTAVRMENSWLVWLLPLGGVATVGLYRLLKLRENRGTNAVIEGVLRNSHLPVIIAPGIFLATAITHLLGGSAGREGAALQLGGSLANNLGQVFRMKQGKNVLTLCGMSAVFAGLFGTPLTAALFTLEFTRVGSIFLPALLPCYLAAFTGAKVSGALGVSPETAPLAAITGLNALSWAKILILAVAIALMGIAMCHIFHGLEHLAAKKIPNDMLRIVLGGGLIALLTLLVGDMRYNGAGMDLALLAVDGNAQWYDFLLKLLFTALTLSAGFKGGEIVPTFCIGATLGCVLGTLLGLDGSMAAALGLVGLFCAVTNSPIAAIALSVEMFGGDNLQLFALVCVIVFILSGQGGLYGAQKYAFSKIQMKNHEDSV